MTRKEKYPETASFIYYNANPKNRITGDCWLRAICTGLDQDYNETLLEMVKVQLETGYEMSCGKAVEKYLENKGWIKHKQPRDWDNKKLTGGQFCKWLSINYPDGEIGNIICNIGGHHMVAIKATFSGDGFNCRYKVHDIWDSTGKCVGNYWTKERSAQ